MSKQSSSMSNWLYSWLSLAASSFNKKLKLVLPTKLERIVYIKQLPGGSNLIFTHAMKMKLTWKVLLNIWWLETLLAGSYDGSVIYKLETDFVDFLKNEKWVHQSTNLSREVTWESFSRIPYICTEVIFFWTFSFDMHLRKVATFGQVLFPMKDYWYCYEFVE